MERPAPTPCNPYANPITGVAVLYGPNDLQSSRMLPLDVNGTPSAGASPDALPTQPTPAEIRRESFDFKGVGQDTIGPRRFSNQALAIHGYGKLGTSNQARHPRIRHGHPHHARLEERYRHPEPGR